MHQIHPHPNHFIQFGKPKEDYLCLSSLAWHSSFIQQAGYLPLLQHKLKSSRLNSQMGLGGWVMDHGQLTKEPGGAGKKHS